MNRVLQRMKLALATLYAVEGQNRIGDLAMTCRDCKVVQSAYYVVYARVEAV